MDIEKSATVSFRLQEFQDENRELQEMYSEFLHMPSIPELKNHKQKLNLEALENLEDEFTEVKTAYSASCENVERLQKEYDKLKLEVEEKTRYNKVKIRRKEDLEKEFTLLSKSKLSHQDLQLLESTKLRYKVLRNMTQVKFEFNKSDNDRLNGFAFNTVNNKIKYFSIANYNNLNEDQISDRIIDCMEEVAGTNYADLHLE